MEIETERLRLRDLEQSDWEVLYRYHSLPEVRRQMFPNQGTTAYVQSWVRAVILAARHDPRRFYAFAMTRKPERTLIGTCILDLSGGWSSRPRLGWDLHPACWGQGFTTEAAQALLDYGRQYLGLSEVTAQCFADNAASRRVMEKLGMRPQRIGRVNYLMLWLRNGRRPWVQYGMDISSWPTGKATDDYSRRKSVTAP